MASKRRASRAPGRALRGAELSPVHGGVGVANVFEDRRQRFGRIQVVVQAFVESPRRLRGALGQRSFEPSRIMFGFQAQLEIAQPVDGGGAPISARRK